MARTPKTDSAGGHYRAAGAAVCGMGLLALALAATTTAAEVELGFIDQPAIFGIAAAFFLVGGSMLAVKDDAE